MKIFHFIGNGEGFMSGIKEYIVISDDPNVPDEDYEAPGFKLDSVTELIQDLPHSLPLNEVLVKRD